jgi:hypothetical protein
MHKGVRWGNLEDAGVDESVIVKWIFKKFDWGGGGAGKGLEGLRMGPGCRHL